MVHRVIRQSWTERERGWGSKPWSKTLHLSKEDMEQFNSAYWDSMPDAVQDWYISPDNNPQTIEVSDKLYKKIVSQTKTLEGNEFGGRGIWHDGSTKQVLEE